MYTLSCIHAAAGRLDYYLHTGVQIDLMKIDVEGHELSVVRRFLNLNEALMER